MGEKNTEPNVARIIECVHNGSPLEEIAAFLGMTPRKLNKFRKDIAQAQARRRMHLRKFQWKAAEAGSVQILALLGKHELGQGEEKPEAEERIIVRRKVCRTPDSGRASRGGRSRSAGNVPVAQTATGV